MELASGDADDGQAETGVQECVVEVGALEGRHPTVVTGLSVKDQVCGEDCAANDSTAVEEALG